MEDRGARHSAPGRRALGRMAVEFEREVAVAPGAVRRDVEYGFEGCDTSRDSGHHGGQTEGRGSPRTGRRPPARVSLSEPARPGRQGPRSTSGVRCLPGDGQRAPSTPQRQHPADPNPPGPDSRHDMPCGQHEPLVEEIPAPSHLVVLRRHGDEMRPAGMTNSAHRFPVLIDSANDAMPGIRAVDLRALPVVADTGVRLASPDGSGPSTASPPRPPSPPTPSPRP